MGSNMYVHVEARDDSQRLRNWNYVPRNIYDGRDYNVFALLAGVRNHNGIEPLDDPRGLPDHITRETWKAYFDDPGMEHPHDRITSWFTLDELEQKVDWDRFTSVWHESEFSQVAMRKLRELALLFSEVRVIFWFDDTVADLERAETRPYTFTARG